MKCLNCKSKNPIEITCSKCSKNICIKCRYQNLHPCLSKEEDIIEYQKYLKKTLPVIVAEKVIKI
jgi:hypothetical protein